VKAASLKEIRRELNVLNPAEWINVIIGRGLRPYFLPTLSSSGVISPGFKYDILQGWSGGRCEFEGDMEGRTKRKSPDNQLYHKNGRQGNSGNTLSGQGQVTIDLPVKAYFLFVLN